MLALIDADIVAYRCAATCEGESESWIPLSRTEDLLTGILHDIGATEYRLYLTGDNNFRKQIYPEYKANRTAPKPKWLVDCKQFLVEEWGAIITDGYEADDALGIDQSKFFSDDPEFGGSPHDCIICSIDKDLLQIPGQHYNFVKKEVTKITIERGYREFYTQLLVGDATDNVKGCPGIGKKKAQKLLDGCSSEEEMFDCVRGQYKNDAAMLLNGKLLWILRKENDIWTHPKLQSETFTKPEGVTSQDSTPSTVGETTQSTEHGSTS